MIRYEYLLVAAAFGLVAWWGWRRRSVAVSSTELYLLIHDGTSFVLHSARRDASGNLEAGGATYPAGVSARVENESDLAAPLYVFAAEPLALAEHRTLEVARRSIVMGNIFKAGGEWTEMLRLVGAGLVVAAALYVTMTIRTLNGSMAEYDAQLRGVRDTLSRPLVVAPGAIAPREVPPVVVDPGEVK